MLPTWNMFSLKNAPKAGFTGFMKKHNSKYFIVKYTLNVGGNISLLARFQNRAFFARFKVSKSCSVQDFKISTFARFQNLALCQVSTSCSLSGFHISLFARFQFKISLFARFQFKISLLPGFKISLSLLGFKILLSLPGFKISLFYQVSKSCSSPGFKILLFSRFQALCVPCLPEIYWSEQVCNAHYWMFELIWVLRSPASLYRAIHVLFQMI